MLLLERVAHQLSKSTNTNYMSIRIGAAAGASGGSALKGGGVGPQGFDSSTHRRLMTRGQECIGGGVGPASLQLGGLHALARVVQRLGRSGAGDTARLRHALLLMHRWCRQVRVMQYDQFMNSKVFFFSERRRFFPGRLTAEADWPVMVHFNYHPDKHKRMLCVWERYVGGKPDACDSLPQAG